MDKKWISSTQCDANSAIQLRDIPQPDMFDKQHKTFRNIFRIYTCLGPEHFM